MSLSTKNGSTKKKKYILSKQDISISIYILLCDDDDENIS